MDLKRKFRMKSKRPWRLRDQKWLKRNRRNSMNSKKREKKWALSLSKRYFKSK